MASEIRVLVLTPYLYGVVPGPRSSIELWEQVLEREGIVFEYAPFMDEELDRQLYRPGGIAKKAHLLARAYGRRFVRLASVREYDAVLVYREAALIGPELFERWVVGRGLPLIFQVDDPIYVPYRSPANGYMSYLKFFGKYARIARMSAVTVVNSNQHREFAERYARHVRMIPILVDGNEYSYEPSAPREEGPVRVGWTGSRTTASNLGMIESSLQSVSRRSDAEIVLIGGEEYDLDGVTYDARTWSAETEVAELRRLDIGLLPAPDSEWNRRKFYMKLIQYMALGVPPVCTPIGANLEVIEHGVDGLFARGPASWTRAIERLIEDAVLRRSMGTAAARKAHQEYTVQARAQDVIEAFRTALRPRS